MMKNKNNMKKLWQIFPPNLIKTVKPQMKTLNKTNEKKQEGNYTKVYDKQNI